MIEYDNIKDALKDAIFYTEHNDMKIISDGVKRDATIEDYQEAIRERLYNIADLLGMSEIYLEHKE